MHLENMTDPQRRAVTTDHPNVFCVAGPGSGKTTVLAERIKRLVGSNNNERRIAAITYTNAAARNLEARINRTTDLERVPWDMSLGYAGTLHGFCLKMLREHGGNAGYGARTAILDDEGARELLAAKAATMGCKDSIDSLVELKRRGRPHRAPGAVYTRDQLVVLSYMDELAETALLDFDMILTEFLRILCKQGPLWQAVKDRFDHVLVDEVQDSAMVDWWIYKALPIANKFLVGDPDQAIFGFRGGEYGLSLKHAANPDVGVITLAENFRCGEEICDAANRLIKHNPGRIPKRTIPEQGAEFGQVGVLFSPHGNEGSEVQTVVDAINSYYTSQDGTVAILARTNLIAAPFSEALEASGTAVATQPKSEMPADWGLTKALLEFLAQPDNNTLAFFFQIARSQRGGASAVSARNTANTIRQDAQAKGVTINELWFQIPKEVADVAQVAGHFMDKEEISQESRMLVIEMARNLPPGATMLDLALEASRRDRPEQAKPTEGVTVTTIHSAKGREFDVVYLVGMEDEVIPGSCGRQDTETGANLGKALEVEEERRLFFVALTRARSQVWITHSATRRANWGQRPLQARTPSRFIKEAIV